MRKLYKITIHENTYREASPTAALATIDDQLEEGLPLDFKQETLRREIDMLAVGKTLRLVDGVAVERER